MSVPIKYSSGLSTLARNLIPCYSTPPWSIPAATTTTLIPRVIPILIANGDLVIQSEMEERVSIIHHGTCGGACSANTELHTAVRSGNLEAVKAIVKNKTELLESQDEQGWTPLSCAAYNGDTTIVRYLLIKFPNSTLMRNGDGSYPTHKACKGGQIEVLKMFPSEHLCQSDRFGQTVLHVAAKEASDRLKNVVSYLMSVDEGRRLIHMTDENEWTSLRWAMHVKNYGVVQIIKQSVWRSIKY